MNDDLDGKILEEIEKNPENSFQNMAKKLGISKGTVRNRILKMKENGLLIDYKVRINHKSVGREDVFVGLDILPEEFIDALEKIKSFSFVKELYATTGDHVAIAYVVENSKNIVECIKMIAGVKGVKKTYPAFVQKVLK
ncbi:MAG: Lrp/AsnC family transcriptional regulator [Thermoplasmata archaeon]